jgi:hypothetical protein
MQEVTTVRGQIIYASQELRTQHSMPQTVAEVDEIDLSQMELFVTLKEMAARDVKQRLLQSPEPSADNCRCVLLQHEEKNAACVVCAAVCCRGVTPPACVAASRGAASQARWGGVRM